ncbi:hypothetical protein [Deinococcus sp.]|uniref:hypothetical protein n=1 Tax=Deinococcus sp. TaxID=47478 RepID=UPI0025BAF05B|nr:hypothetical protein [Deinococcus sp.]
MPPEAHDPAVTLRTPTKYLLPPQLSEPQTMPTPTRFGDEWAIIATADRPPYGNQIAQLIVLALVLGGGIYGLNIWAGTDSWKLVLANGSVLLILGLLLLSVLGYAAHILQIWKKQRQSERFGAPILFLNQHHYAPDDPLRLSFQRDLKPHVPALAGATLSGYLRCVEITCDSSGSMATYSHIVHAEEDLGQCPTGGVSLRGGFTGQLPPNAKATRLSESNALVWEMQVRQQVPGQLDETSSFLIPVVSA